MKDRRRDLTVCFAALGAFLAVLGGRLAMSDVLAVDLPFWDQWGAEGGTVYLPWKTGTLTAAALGAPHNEHYIVVPRLLALGVFAANDAIWDVRLSIAVNAVLHAASWVVLGLALGRGLGTVARMLLLAGAAVLGVLPFGWENLMAGFQSCFYLSLLFQWPALLLLVTRPPLSRAWLGGLALSVLAFLSLASGFVAAFVAAGVAAFIAATDTTRRQRAILAAAILLLFCATCIAVTPSIEAHALLRARTPAGFLLAFATLLAWPFVVSPWLALLVSAPWIAVAVAWLHAPRNDRVFVVAFGAWIAVQAAIVAYGRGGSDAELASRYLDLVVPGVLLGCACFAHLLRATRGGMRSAVAVTCAIWLSAVAFGLARAVPVAWTQASARSAALRVQAEHVRDFLASDDERVLLDAAPFEIPVPKEYAASLVRTLRRADFVSMLSFELRGRGAARRGPLTGVSEALLARGGWIAALGVFVLFSSALGAMMRRGPEPQGDAR